MGGGLIQRPTFETPGGASIDTKFVFHYSRAMKNVTITMDEEIARWARIKAAERNTSVSRMVGEILRERMEADRRYASARREFSAVEARQLRAPGQQLPSREELHERSDLR
jgi:hypothetical protein